MRSYRALLNFISSFGRNVIGTLLSLIATPYILSYIGQERFGALRILLDWLSHIGILEFGLYSASLALLSKASSEGAENLNHAIQLIFKKYILVFAMQIFAFFVFTFFLKNLIPVSEDLQDELRLSSIVMAITLFFLVSQVFKAFLESTQKGYLVSFILIIFNICYLALSCYFAKIGSGLPGQAWSYVISLFISLILFATFAPEVFRGLFNHGNNQSNTHLLRTQRFSHFINELCGRISLMSDNIIISIFMGAEVVTAFFITQKAVNMIQTQLQHLSNSSWAALSELYYQNKKEIFNQRVLELTELIAFFSGSLLAVACLFNESFVVLWTGRSTFAGSAVTNICALNAALFSILSLWSWCFAATNQTQKMVTMSVVQGLVNIISSIVLTKYFGILGPILGTFIGYSMISMGWKSWVLSRTFNIHFLNLTLAWARPLLPPIAIVILYISIFDYIHVDRWWKLIFYSALSTGLFTYANYIILLSKNTKLLVREKIKLFNPLVKK